MEGQPYDNPFDWLLESDSQQSTQIQHNMVQIAVDQRNNQQSKSIPRTSGKKSSQRTNIPTYCWEILKKLLETARNNPNFRHNYVQCSRLSPQQVEKVDETLKFLFEISLMTRKWGAYCELQPLFNNKSKEFLLNLKADYQNQKQNHFKKYKINTHNLDNDREYEKIRRMIPYYLEKVIEIPQNIIYLCVRALRNFIVSCWPIIDGLINQKLQRIGRNTQGQEVIRNKNRQSEHTISQKREKLAQAMYRILRILNTQLQFEKRIFEANILEKVPGWGYYGTFQRNQDRKEPIQNEREKFFDQYRQKLQDAQRGDDFKGPEYYKGCHPIIEQERKKDMEEQSNETLLIDNGMNEE